MLPSVVRPVLAFLRDLRQLCGSMGCCEPDGAPRNARRRRILLTLRGRGGKLSWAGAGMNETARTDDGPESRELSPLDRMFHLTERNATLRGEILGGLTTFMTMAYIIFVNAAILSAAGMPAGAVMVATCLAAAFATAVMGLYANLPIALAPGMGLNAFVAFTVCGAMGFSWQQALGMVFWSGVIFLVLSLVRFRETVINAIPRNLKYGAAAGIGLFIAFIGLQHAGFVVYSPHTIVAMGNLTAKHSLVALFGLVLTGALLALCVRGAVLFGMLATGALALATGLVTWRGGQELGFTGTFLKLDILGALSLSAIPAILTLLFFDTFDTVGTLMGVAEEAGLVDDEGRIPNVGRALASDAAGTVVGSLLGTSTVTSYIESAAGVAAGARTGLSSVVTSVLFLLSLAALPVVAILGQGCRIDLATALGGASSVQVTYASGFVQTFDAVTLYPITAPALIVVGFLMTGPLKRIDWDDASEGFPAFLTVILMPLTFSISTGLAAGFVSYSLLKAVRGERKVHPLVHVIAATIVVGYALLKVIAHLKAAQ